MNIKDRIKATNRVGEVMNEKGIDIKTMQRMLSTLGWDVTDNTVRNVSTNRNQTTTWGLHVFAEALNVQPHELLGSWSPIASGVTDVVDDSKLN